MSPAGRPTDAEGQQPVSGVVVTSAREQRVLDWLITQVGHEAVISACDKLAGGRKPFPSNIAKILELQVPGDLVFTPRDDALRLLKGILDLASPQKDRFGNDP